MTTTTTINGSARFEYLLLITTSTLTLGSAVKGSHFRLGKGCQAPLDCVRSRGEAASAPTASHDISQSKRAWDPLGVLDGGRRFSTTCHTVERGSLSRRIGTWRWTSSSGEEVFRTRRAQSIAARPSYMMSPTLTRKHGHTCVEVALTTTDQLPLPPRRANFTTVLVRDKCPSIDGVINIPYVNK